MWPVFVFLKDIYRYIYIYIYIYITKSIPMVWKYPIMKKIQRCSEDDFIRVCISLLILNVSASWTFVGVFKYVMYLFKFI